MLKNQSIICFANDFRGDPTSKQQVMSILSSQNTVLWVNSIAMRRPSVSASDASRILSKIKKFFRGIDEVSDNLHVFTPLVLPLPSSAWARRLNTLLLTVYLKYYIRKYRMKNIQLWTFIPTMVELLGKLDEKLVVYYCVDEWSEFSFVDKASMQEMEKRLLQKSDVVFTTAEKLYRSKMKFNPNTHLIRHGVDYRFFSSALAASTPVPAELASIPQPRIGFFGLIHEWVDISLLEAMALRHPEWSIVLVGKTSDSFDTARLARNGNIHFLGQKQYRELAGYCKGFQVGIIPFAITPLTINVNPIKLREYLAAGLPVVSSNLPEIYPFKGVVHIAEDQDRFMESVEQALTEVGEDWIAKRQRAVSEETWDARVEEMSAIIEQRQGACHHQTADILPAANQ